MIAPLCVYILYTRRVVGSAFPLDLISGIIKVNNYSGLIQNRKKKNRYSGTDMGGAFLKPRGELKKYFNGGLALITRTVDAFGVRGRHSRGIFFSHHVFVGGKISKGNFEWCLGTGNFTGTTQIYML